MSQASREFSSRRNDSSPLHAETDAVNDAIAALRELFPAPEAARARAARVDKRLTSGRV